MNEFETPEEKCLIISFETSNTVTIFYFRLQLLWIFILELNRNAFEFLGSFGGGAGFDLKNRAKLRNLL